MPAALPRELDVLVVGAGPAGAVIAGQLAPQFRVAVVARQAGSGRVIGESLPSAARRPLCDLGLWAAFEAQGHRPAPTRLSIWGRPDVAVQDAIMDPQGAGWHLDRVRFDALLRASARQHGALMLEPARLRQMQWRPDPAGFSWRCEIDTAEGPWTPRCRFLVDATGRSAWVLRHAGVDLARDGNLVCLHTSLASPAAGLEGATLVESTPDGWWYSADLADGRCVVAWHCDADLGGIRRCRDAEDLLAQAMPTRLLGLRCKGARALEALRCTPAHSQWPQRCSGKDWLAIGDASLAFDPLASQGLLHGLVTGIEGALIARGHLCGDSTALSRWDAYQQRIAGTYRARLRSYYGMERRWPGEPFWQRRLQAGEAAAIAELPETGSTVPC